MNARRFRMSSPLRLAGVLSAVGLLAAACSGAATSTTPAASSGSASPAATASEAATSPSPAASRSWEGLLDIKVVEDWTFLYPPWQIWLYPEAQGWYRDAGLNVEFVIPPTPADPPKLIASGRVDFGFTYTPDVLIASTTGLNTKAVAALIPVPSESLICRNDVGINSPTDLEGKTIARYDAPLPEAQFKIFAAKQGIDISKVNFVPAGDNGYPIMIAKQADCTQAGVFEPSFYKVDTGQEAKVFYYTEWGIPDWYWEIIAVNPTFAEQHPDAVRAFVDVTLRGYEWARNNVSEGVEFLYQKDPSIKPTTADDPNIMAMEAMFARQRDYMSGKPAGYMDPSIWQRFADLLAQYDVLTQDVDVNSILTNEFLPGN